MYQNKSFAIVSSAHSSFSELDFAVMKGWAAGEASGHRSPLAEEAQAALLSFSNWDVPWVLCIYLLLFVSFGVLSSRLTSGS